MHARIASYTDDRAAITYHDVEPLATAPILGNLRWELPIAHAWDAAIVGRYVDRTHLANDGNDALVTPGYTLVDLALHFVRPGQEWRVELTNVLDANAYAGGYADSGVRYFYPIATRTLLVTLRLATGGAK